MIGIIVADSNEINKFDFPKVGEKKIKQFEFNIYEIKGEVAVVVHSGIGIANAAAATQELISAFPIDTIYNYGAVGGDSEVNVFDIITPKKIFYHDVVTPWYKRGQTPGEKEFYLNDLSSDLNNNLASGSSFLADEDAINKVKEEIDVNIFDMETAAIAQIADKNNIKLRVIKCVSDAIGKDDSQLENINDRIAKAGKFAFIEMISKI